MYDYRATVERVVDGDTLWLDTDLGCDTHLRLSVRLYGLNCPEAGTIQGTAATAFTQAWVDSHDAVVGLQTFKDGKEKYGRYLGLIYDLDQPDRRPTLNDALIDAGHALYYLPR